jgi:hypothetical protein
MFMFLVVITVFGLIGYIEIVPMIKQAQVKEMILYISVFAVAFVISLLLGMNIKLPSPAKPMDDLITVVFKLFSS